MTIHRLSQAVQLVNLFNVDGSNNDDSTYTKDTVSIHLDVADEAIAPSIAHISPNKTRADIVCDVQHNNYLSML